MVSSVPQVVICQAFYCDMKKWKRGQLESVWEASCEPVVTISLQECDRPNCNVVGEVPIWVGSPAGGSHKGGSPRAFPTDGEHTSMGTSTYVKVSSFSFIHSFLLVFKKIILICPIPPCVFEFLLSVPSKNFLWEHRNIGGSPPSHNSLGIFCWGRSLKMQREVKREVLTCSWKFVYTWSHNSSMW